VPAAIWRGAPPASGTIHTDGGGTIGIGRSGTLSTRTPANMKAFESGDQIVEESANWSKKRYAMDSSGVARKLP
jgi:hypothetical protein